MISLIKILRNSSGIALMMVLTSITILTLLMYTFRFDTSIHKIKSSNLIARTQARLNAEAGLKMGLLRLEIYQEIKAAVDGNENMKRMASPEMLNMIWSLPLMFPLPILPTTSMREKSMIEEFERESLLNGEIQINIESLASKINLNMLRVSNFKDLQGGGRQRQSEGQRNPDEPGSAEEEIEKRLAELIIMAINSTQETDEAFFQRYSATRVEELIAAIKFYISDENIDIGPFRTQVESEFNRMQLTAKHAPMTSISELYLLPGWNDDLVNLIKNEITVHGTPMIDVNQLSGNLLRMLVPGITLQQIEDFYEYKSNPMNPEMPITFNSVDDIKRYFTQEARIIGENGFDQQVKLLQDAGIQFGASPKMFKLISTGKFQNNEYTIQAIVSMEDPSQETSRPQTRPEQGEEEQTPPTQQQQQRPSRETDRGSQASKPLILEITII